MIWVKIERSYANEWESVNWPEARQALLECADLSDIEVEEALPEEKPKDLDWHISIRRHRVTFEEADRLSKSGLKVTLQPLAGTMVTKMRDREEWDGREVEPSDLIEAKAINIALPDTALLKIDEVTWLDDACTEELQDHLNDGWRILAVCPPNSARRPDYILGRRKEFYE